MTKNGKNDKNREKNYKNLTNNWEIFFKKNDKQLGKKMTKNWGKMSKYFIFSAKIISFFIFF